MIKISKKKGFTLIELIVVIAILGILTAIAVPRLAGFRATAETSANNRTIDTITKSIEVAIAGDRINDGTIIATPDATTGIVTFSGSATLVAANNPAAVTTIPLLMADLMDVVTIQNNTAVRTWTIAGGNVTLAP